VIGKAEPGIGEYDIPVVDLLPCEFLDDFVCDDDPITDVIVDFMAQRILCLSKSHKYKCTKRNETKRNGIKFIQVHVNAGETYILLGQVNIRSADVQLELPDGIAHRDGHGPCGYKVCDLGREMRHEVPREGVVRRRIIVLNDLPTPIATQTHNNKKRKAPRHEKKEHLQFETQLV